MFSLKTRKTYQSPRTKVAEVDLEGLICQSNLNFVREVDELNNVNYTKKTSTGDTVTESLYFEF